MDKLAPNYQSKMQNIIQYYTEYRKSHYTDTVGITIENQRREEKRKDIYKELKKLKDVKSKEKYVLLNDERRNIYEQIEAYECSVTDEIFETLCTSLGEIEDKQLEIIKAEGINIKFLEDNNYKINGCYDIDNDVE